jgi:hypothetical protein
MQIKGVKDAYVAAEAMGQLLRVIVLFASRSFSAALLSVQFTSAIKVRACLCLLLTFICGSMCLGS